MMYKHPKFDPSTEGPNFFIPYMTNYPSCTTSRKRRTAHQSPRMTHGFQDIAQEHTPTASAAFYIAQWEEIEPPSKPSAPRNRKGDWFETKRRGAEKSVGRYRRERRVIAIFVDEAEKKLNRQAAKAAKESQRGFG